MQVFNQMLFDDTISGASTTWYTPDQYNDMLGAADTVGFMAQVSAPGGTDPLLTVTAQESADGRHWEDVVDVVSNEDITEEKLFIKSIGYRLSLLRLKISLAGTNPECRLKLYATGHTT